MLGAKRILHLLPSHRILGDWIKADIVPMFRYLKLTERTPKTGPLELCLRPKELALDGVNIHVPLKAKQPRLLAPKLPSIHDSHKPGCKGQPYDAPDYENDANRQERTSRAMSSSSEGDASVEDQAAAVQRPARAEALPAVDAGDVNRPERLPAHVCGADAIDNDGVTVCNTRDLSVGVDIPQTRTVSVIH